MEIIKAILLGAIQGFTEFLPISSSGHLAIFAKILHLNFDQNMYFDILLHLGTLVSICIVFHKEVWKMIVSFFQILGTCLANFVIWIRHRKGNREQAYIRVLSNGYRKMVVLIIVSTIPTGILGFVGKDLVAWATNTLWAVGVGLLITSGLLLLANRFDQGTTGIKKMKFSSAFFIGIGQGLATLPGISRSGTTISLSMLLGIEKKTAVRYSFLMSLPAVLGAVVLDLKDLSGETISGSQIATYVIGMLVAAGTGYVALRWMLHLIRNKKYTGFAIYCAAMGLVTVIASFFIH